MKKIILLVVIFTCLLLSAYYFGVFLPKKEARIAEQQKQEQPEVVDESKISEKKSEGCQNIKEEDFALYYKYKFEDYPIVEKMEGTSQPLNLKSHPRGFEFKTRITEAYKNGPNFAGHYTVVEWGCGTGCQNHVIVDNLTGNIIENEIASNFGIEYRKDSRLLVARMGENGFGVCDDELPFVSNFVFEYFEVAKDQAMLKGLTNIRVDIDTSSWKSVVRYGGLFRFSGSGDMRFSYFDMEKNIFLNEWDGHPWFFGSVDAKYVDYIGNHSDYVFKITGRKVEDDCDYYGDGRCMENIIVDKIEAVLDLKTEVVVYKPPTILPKDVRNGECWASSLALYQRDDAYRCTSGDSIYDPCFALPDASDKVICVNSEDKEFIIKQDVPLYKKSENFQASEGGGSQKIELSNGIMCDNAPGATFMIQNERASYVCSDGTWLAGEPNTEYQVWTIKRAFLSPGDGYEEDRIERVSNIGIKKVWQ